MEPSAEPFIHLSLPPLRDQTSTPPPTTLKATSPPFLKSPWIPIAAASGTCAAFNGVFAKLTTTELTSTWASAISTTVGFSATNKFVEFLIRAGFFSLNLAFNALMWALFTAALTRASSTTRVSIVNTSANFMLTAFSGWLVFGEKLPGLWWVGAAGLVVGNVFIGRREEEEDGSAGKRDLLMEGEREERDRENFRDWESGEEGESGIELRTDELKGGGGVRVDEK